MSEPVMLWFAMPVGLSVMLLSDWVTKQKKCKDCGANLKVVREIGHLRALVSCPNGCGK